MRETTDILISGSGVAGLTAACAFGSAGFGVICIDPTPPVTNAEDPTSDLRTTAFLQPSLPVLQAAGLWARLEPHAAALQVMRIIDAGGATPDARLVKEFDAADISDAPFGWNLPNWLLRREMVARLAELPSVSFRPGTGFARMLSRQDETLVTLTDGSQLAAKLVIGADGRDSPVREALGVAVKTTRYGQKARAFWP
jgi:2-octaprenyl-6-methoxyphenol hydroxylase